MTMGKPSKIDAVLTELIEQGKMLSAIQTSHNDMKERIFGGQQPGIIHYLAEKDKEISTALTAAVNAADARSKTIEKDVAELKTQRRVGKAYIAGGVAAGSMLGWVVKAGLLKIGVHIP